MDAATYKKCPKCSSENYNRSKSVDLVIIHRKYKRTKRKYVRVQMPWIFTCQDCGHGESEWKKL